MHDILKIRSIPISLMTASIGFLYSSYRGFNIIVKSYKQALQPIVVC